MNGESTPGEENGGAEGTAPEETESWWQVCRVAACCASVTLVTSLLVMPLAALVWGWSPSVIVSGSMEPALSRGDVVAARSATVQEVGGGAVISFKDAARGDRMTTHRAVERLEDGAAYRTKGDANRDPDPALVRAEQLEGIVTVAIPYAGTAWLWLQDGEWGAAAVAVAVYVLLLRGCRNGARDSGPALATP
ncbi:signal peptidase I [Kitasatospora sp. NPDC093806]|uniref:signal peptidase I n=1 Tax=Kitasatospora sp. NPDC093806 TaxID=3155075 RepID=UPI00342023F7